MFAYPFPVGDIFTVHMSCANTNKTVVVCTSLLTQKHKVLPGGSMFPVLHLNSETRTIVLNKKEDDYTKMKCF